MTKYRLVYNRKDCIGVFTCGALSPKFWELDKDGKANLKGATLNEKTGLFELEIDEENFGEARASAEVCPVEVIAVEKIEDDGTITRLHPKSN